MTELDYRTTRLFKVLGNPLRYKLLRVLADSPQTPSDLARLVHRPLPAVSRALHLLDWAGIVEYRTCGHFVLYRLKHAQVDTLIGHGRDFIRQFELPVPPQSEAPDMRA